jgi:hypothetical protein
MTDSIEIAPGQEDAETEDLTAVEEMQNIYRDTQAMIGKYKKLAGNALQQGDQHTANIYTKIADDILPLFSDHIQSTGSFAAEMSDVVAELEENGVLGEAGAEGETPAVDEDHAVVEKVELQALYQLIVSMVSFFELSLKHKAFAKKPTVQATAEALLSQLKPLAEMGVQTHGLTLDTTEFSTKLEAAFK